MNPLVDLVIACHDPRRQVGRAVKSALAGGDGKVRVTVVAHNIAAATLTEQWADCPPEQVRCLELADGVPAPAGPFNHGLQAATAPWVAIMGSDDSLEPGALMAWTKQAQANDADIVLARVQVGDKELQTPRARPWGGPVLDPIRDRVLYRTAPLGAMRRQKLLDLGLVLTPGLSTGEDISFTAHLVLAGRVALATRRSPKYLVHTDAPERVTGSAPQLERWLTPLELLLAEEWVCDLPPVARTALVTKLLRIHLIPAIRAAGEQDQARWHQVYAQLRHLAPQALWALTQAELATLNGTVATGRLAWLLAAKTSANLNRESALRAYLSTRLRATGITPR